MSGYRIEVLASEPILLVTIEAEWNTERDTDAALAGVMAALDVAHAPLAYIVDLSIEPRFNLDDLMFVTGRLLQGRNAILHHPNLQQTLVVTRNAVMQRAVRVLPRFARAHAFETLDDALAYAGANYP